MVGPTFIGKAHTKNTRTKIDMYATARFSSAVPLNGAFAVMPRAIAVADSIMSQECNLH
jgi:hypothetical protein